MWQYSYETWKLQWTMDTGVKEFRSFQGCMAWILWLFSTSARATAIWPVADGLIFSDHPLAVDFHILPSAFKEGSVIEGLVAAVGGELQETLVETWGWIQDSVKKMIQDCVIFPLSQGSWEKWFVSGEIKEERFNNLLFHPFYRHACLPLYSAVSTATTYETTLLRTNCTWLSISKCLHPWIVLPSLHFARLDHKTFGIIEQWNEIVNISIIYKPWQLELPLPSVTCP